ncbi:MAG: Rrf2 family transcriptional regulator [Chloroflexota bacterium]
MKITKKSEYAVRALMQIALSGTESMVRASDIAAKENMSVKFLEQVLALLKNRGIVEARRGVGGGYVLNRPPENITVAEVIRLVDGPLAPVSCVSEMAYVPCERNERLCALRSVMVEVRQAILDVLEKTTLADLCQRSRELTEAEKTIPLAAERPAGR